MDITITWTDGGGVQSTDGWNVLYREKTPTNTNNWILATDPDLPPTPTQYTLTGLTPNVIYDIAVVKSCNSVFDFVSQKTYVSVSCPIVSTWQGPVVNGKPTLFYSVYYEEGSDISGTAVRLYDSTPISFQLTNAVGNGLSILFTTGVVHDFKVGSEVTVSGVNPSSYNGTYEIVSKTATAFVVNSPNTGLYVSGGTATYQPGMLEDIQPYSTVNSVVGKTTYQVIDPAVGGLPFIQVTNCGTDALAFNAPNSTNSVAGYFGTEHSSLLPAICDATIGQNGAAGTYNPILLNYNTTLSPREYKLGTDALLNDNSVLFVNSCPADSIIGVTTSFTFDDDDTQPYRNLNVANSANLSAAICFDILTGNVDYTLGDGLGRTNINDYVFSFATSDGALPLFPLLDNAGNPVTSYNGSYTIYAPVKIQSSTIPAPGGGNPLGYTITNAVVSGGNTTYTYIGGTNAFTIGQQVFVNNVNPVSFNFSLTSNTIIAATPNSFTVSYNPAGTYQTGGNASGYIELTDGMTVTVDLLPGPVNLITLTNQNYSGLTLIQALEAIATSINTNTSYTTLAVVVAGLPYIKIGIPGTTYTSASIKFEGPSILTKGTPDILQNSVTYGPLTTTTNGSVNYNGFLYSSYDSGALIIGSDINNPTVATNYSHPINIGVYGLELVDEPAPSIAYSLDHVGSGGNYSLNIALDSNTGYVYVADNTTVSIYDGDNIIDSQDLSALPGGPTTPIRLMEFNTTDNTLYVFVDSSGLDNFFIVDVAPWSIITSGVYSQTNYLKRGTVTAWNNLTTGPTAAKGTITSAPPVLQQPILCSTMPCACIAGGPVSPPCPPGVPTWVIGRNDGVRSELFQDSTKNWPTNSGYNTGFFHVYNYNTQQLGVKTIFQSTDPYRQLEGLSGDTIVISAAADITVPYSYSTFASSSGDSYGLFSIYLIADYNENFTSRSWENTARYLIENGRNEGSNGFITTPVINPTYVIPDSYTRNFPNGEKQINSALGLDGTSEYLLYEIKDGGTCYNNVNNLVYVSLGNGTYQTITSGGTVSTPYQIYVDFPTNSVLLNAPLQLTVDPVGGNVYGIIRDARLDSTIDDKNIYILSATGQIGTVDGLSKWNTPICGQPSFDSNKLYFTGKYNRTIYEYDLNVGTYTSKVIPSVYEKLNGFVYGDGLLIERIQGASSLGGNKFVVMNYLQQTCITQLKYTYDVANLFVYDFGSNTVEQVLIGTGVSSYSGPAASYNPNYYGESFGINDYNNDYCYGGLSITSNPNTGQVFWKKSISDQVYFSEGHPESGIAQIWGSGTGSVGAKLIRIWNVQNDGLGTLVPSKRTILDIFSTLNNFEYDSYYNKVLTYAGSVGSMFQFYLINPKTLGGIHGVNTVSPFTKNAFSGSTKTIAALCPTASNNGKITNVYAVIVTPTDITYYVRPTSASINGYFPHQYAVGEVVTITGIVSSPANELNFPNGNVGAATIIAVTPTTFTIANIGSTTATYTSGGVVQDAKWVNLYGGDYFTRLKSSQNGDIILFGGLSGNSASAGINNAYSSFIFKYGPNDILTQRENPQIINTGITSSICSATPDGLFTDFRAAYQKTNSFMIHVPSQNTYWVLGTKNPTCNVFNVTNAVYNAGTQTVRYFINNSFLVGKIVNISGITPSTYNVSSVAITAVDTLNSPQQWFEISYTGANPGAFIPPTPPLLTGQVSLSPFYVIKVLDDTTFATIATIDLGFNNSFVASLVGGFFIDRGRFQYSAATEEIYMYSEVPTWPVYVFSTVSNSLVRSSDFNRMVTPYNKLTNVAMLEDVNGVPYFIAYTGADTPNRRWFRIDLGNRVYQNNVHDNLIVSTTDVVGTTSKTYDLYNLNNMSDTFGQWKEITDTTWATIPSALTLTLGDRVEFVSFIVDKPLVEIRNLTQATTFAITSTSGLPLVTMLIDGIAVVSGDVLEFEFTNPANPSCPFINQTTITII